MPQPPQSDFSVPPVQSQSFPAPPMGRVGKSGFGALEFISTCGYLAGVGGLIVSFFLIVSENPIEASVGPLTFGVSILLFMMSAILSAILRIGRGLWAKNLI
ncbi:hypothetical protein [Corynebacterium sp. H130]|uniref:hypothetical protein n=1 Tax=Corynebacterium sp. H130 TaxID=3133444 RepID=UPI0030A4A69D